jgi:hypothetical protein
MSRALLFFLLCVACSSPARESTSRESTTPASAPSESTAPTVDRAPSPETPTAEAMAAFAATEGQPPRDRARVACERLLGGARFVGPETERPPAVPETTWRLVHEPVESYRNDHRELTFFAERGGEILEAHVDARTGALETFSLEAIARTASEPTCEAPTSCGCFHVCAEVVRLGPDTPDARYRVLGTAGGLALHRVPQCYEGACARVCDGPGHCIDALSQVEETCTGACAPDEAPFHCARGPSGCERVAH